MHRGKSRGSELSETSRTGSTPSEENPYDTGDAVRVILRCRPMNESEKARNDDKILEVVNQNTIQIVTMGPGQKEVHKNYQFNSCVAPECTQEEFFDQCGIKALLKSALNGYAATVFAYGQTGSGKTYSMSGQEEQIAREEWEGGDYTDGIIPRAMAYLFDNINRSGAEGDCRYTTRASYCEIYNEQVFDLLNLTSGSLPVRWNVRNGFFVQDLFVVECEELADVMAVVSEGHRNRRVGSHELNKDSSRSHSILTIHLESESIDPDDGHTLVKFGKIVFTDLAGSERLKDTKSEGVTLTETGAINKSLFTLSNVIASLSDKKNKGAFVPYRDSKLTKLLMDSLGGTSMTLMIACCSPSSQFVEETLSTLNYATRARSIKNKPMVQVDPKEQLIYNLRQEVKLLRMENSYLRDRLGIAPSDNPSNNNSNNNSRTPVSPIPRANSSSSYQSSPSNRRFSGSSPSRTSSSRGPPPGLGGRESQASNLSAGSSITRNTKQSPRVATLYADTSTASFNSSLSAVSNGSLSNSEVQKLLGSYQKEIERMKQENAEIRAKGGVAERGYRAVMSENERLASKLEHLEEIFVHQSGANGRQTPWQQEQQESKADAQVANNKLKAKLRRLQVENEALSKKLKMFEHSSAAHGSAIDYDKESDYIQLQLENKKLNEKIVRLVKREMNLLNNLKAQSHQPMSNKKKIHARHSKSDIVPNIFPASPTGSRGTKK